MLVFQPSPGGTRANHELCILFNGVKTGDWVSDASTLFATRQTIFCVVHSSFQWWPGWSHFQSTGPDPAQFEANWQQFLDQPQVTAATVEQALRQSVPPDKVIELASCSKYKVETSTLSCGFYYKKQGDWTWTSIVIRTVMGADLLKAFLEGRISPAAQPGAALAPAPSAPLGAGTPVVVQWSDGKAYQATVLGAGEGGYSIHFGDGQPHWVPAHCVRPAQ